MIIEELSWTSLTVKSADWDRVIGNPGLVVLGVVIVEGSHIGE